MSQSTRVFRTPHCPYKRGFHRSETGSIGAARSLFGLTNAELERILDDPEQILTIADILVES